MEARVAEAFVPAAISNFFQIHDEPLSHGYADLSRVGATGGGFTLSRGVRSTATIVRGLGRPSVDVVVNGDPSYAATTTRRALALLLDAARGPQVRLTVEQRVEVPIGHGFGTSAASSLSAVMAAAAALGLRLTKEGVAYYAHAAEIVCQTGLGTVSTVYDHAGAGLILKAGGPGVAEVVNVEVPKGVELVTASLGPYRKSDLLSSPRMRARANALGAEALLRASDLDFGSLLRAGEYFARGLGLETPEVERLVRTAMERGAMGASQNMIGRAIHAVVRSEDLEGVVAALESDSASPRVEVFRVGVAPTSVGKVEVVDYPRTSRSFV